MKELNKEICTLLEMYFDKKTKRTALSDNLQDKIWDMVYDLMEDIEDLVRETNNNIDFAIAEESKSANERFEMEQQRESDLVESYRRFWMVR